MGSLRFTTATSTKTPPRNVALDHRKFLTFRPSRPRRTMWVKYPKNKLVRAGFRVKTETEIFTFYARVVVNSSKGSLRNDDADGKDDATKQ